MTAEEFTVQIMDMKKTLYHVACGILRSEPVSCRTRTPVSGVSIAFSPISAIPAG